MTALAVVLLAAAVAFAAWRCYEPVPDLLDERMRRKVIITLKTGEAFSGVLYATDERVLVLREAVALAYGPKAESVVVEGEAVLDRADVAYMQIP